MEIPLIVSAVATAVALVLTQREIDKSTNRRRRAAEIIAREIGRVFP